ncbi:MAG: heparan-alpha-glucosaminide N-acetyltransferase domain-containing protein, partial [Eubacteriales bacterium]
MKTIESRHLEIDRFRGLAIILMVLVNYLSGVDFIPALMKHAPDIGFTIADTIAPFFIFAIALNFGPAMDKRLQQGRLSAYMHFVTRYFALVGIGALFTLGGTTVAGQPTDWGVLQAIGVAGLICLLFIRCRCTVRFAAGVIILCAYQFTLDNWTLQTVLGSVQGGFYGTLSWGAMLIIATVMADQWRRGMKPYVILCSVISVVGAVSAFIEPVSKHRVSISYVFITLAISGFVFLLFSIGSRRFHFPAGFLCWWGENPITLYILHLMILGIFAIPSAPWWYAGAPPWLVVLQLAVLFGLLSLAAY